MPHPKKQPHAQRQSLLFLLLHICWHPQSCYTNGIRCYSAKGSLLLHAVHVPPACTSPQGHLPLWFSTHSVYFLFLSSQLVLPDVSQHCNNLTPSGSFLTYSAKATFSSPLPTPPARIYIPVQGHKRDMETNTAESE